MCVCGHHQLDHEMKVESGAGAGIEGGIAPNWGQCLACNCSKFARKWFWNKNKEYPERVS